MKVGDTTRAQELLSAQLRADAVLLRALAKVRADGVRTLEWGELALSLSPQMVALLELLFPDFTAPDRKVRNAAWRWFANSDWGKSYRTQPDALRRY